MKLRWKESERGRGKRGINNVNVKIKGRRIDKRTGRPEKWKSEGQI